MSGRISYLSGLFTVGLALVPAVSQADVRIEERSSTLDSTVTRWIAIKEDKRAIVSRADVSGVLYNAGARYGAYVEIARPDKELIWELDPQERSYREISAAQFSRILQKGVQAPRNPADQQLRSRYRSETTAIEVAPTGKQKRIAGYPAEEVMARVIVGAQNLQTGNQLRFTFDQHIWITRDEQLLREVRGFEEAYIEQFGSAATLTQAQLMAGEWSDAFITHLRAVNDRVRALGGFPLASTTTVTEEALAQGKGEKNASRTSTVATTEVRKITLESVPAAEMEVPVGFINSDTKVAIAPRDGAPVVMARAEAPPVVPAAPVAPVAPPAAPVVAKAPDVPKPPVVRATGKEPVAPGVVAVTPGAATPAAPGEAAAPRPPVVATAPPPAAPPAAPVETAVKPEAPTVAAPPVVTAKAETVTSPGEYPLPPAAVAKPRMRTKTTPVFVDAYAPTQVQSNYAVLRPGRYAVGVTASPVTVGEPEDILQRGKKRR